MCLLAHNDSPASLGLGPQMSARQSSGSTNLQLALPEMCFVALGQRHSADWLAGWKCGEPEVARKSLKGEHFSLARAVSRI